LCRLQSRIVGYALLRLHHLGSVHNTITPDEAVPHERAVRASRDTNPMTTASTSRTHTRKSTRNAALASPFIMPSICDIIPKCMAMPSALSPSIHQDGQHQQHQGGRQERYLRS
jgi:hypothetical protein